MVSVLPSVRKMQHCEDCVFGKLTRLPIRFGRSWKAKHKLQLVHADMCGPMQSNPMEATNIFFFCCSYMIFQECVGSIF